MSTRRGNQHRRWRNYGRSTEIGWLVTYAACAAEADLPDARQAAHDTLIKLSGGHRRGGVQWSWWPAREAPEVIRQVEGAGVGKWSGHLQYLADNPDGFLVMARCRATLVNTSGH